MADAIQALVVIDSGLSQESVERCLPRVGVEVVGIVDGIDSSWETVQETPSDVLVVACAGYSERALFLINGAVKQRPSRPAIVFAFSAPEGFMRRLFEMGTMADALSRSSCTRRDTAIAWALSADSRTVMRPI